MQISKIRDGVGFEPDNLWSNFIDTLIFPAESVSFNFCLKLAFEHFIHASKKVQNIYGKTGFAEEIQTT